MSDFMTISLAADRIGVSPDTIRRWDKKGLIKASRDEHNYRVFNILEILRIHTKILGTDNNTNNYKILINADKTEYTAIDLFAGAGGTALGLENAGLNHIMLNEFDATAVRTLRKNRPGWNVVHDDIKNINFSNFDGKVDVIEGGFPCQSFSVAGKKRGLEDARGTLFYEFARAIKEAKPKIAMGENVKGLLLHEGGKTLKLMVDILDGLGYDVAYKVMRSQYLDVPQKRERLILLAVRKNLGIPILFPKEKDYTISIKEALYKCPKSEGQEYSERKKHIMSQVPAGGYWKDLPEDLKKEYMKASYYMGGGKTGMARRLSWDEPSLTLTCNPAQKQTERCHPKETRPLNVREYARIQTFPDNWEFEGSTAARYKQIGNAVPVNLGFYMGECIIAMLNKKPDLKTMEVVSPIN
jgi:DNA (cytosine-5)-methyltransferase 1